MALITRPGVPDIYEITSDTIPVPAPTQLTDYTFDSTSGSPNIVLKKSGTEAAFEDDNISEGDWIWDDGNSELYRIQGIDRQYVTLERDAEDTVNGGDLYYIRQVDLYRSLKITGSSSNWTIEGVALGSEKFYAEYFEDGVHPVIIVTGADTVTVQGIK